MKKISVLNKFFGKFVIPMSYYVRRDQRYTYYNQYKKNLTKTKQEIKDYQLERLKKLIHHAYNTVPYYKELFNKLNLEPEDIKSFEDLKKIPPLTKKTVINSFNKLKSKIKYKVIEISSGGSTGNRITVLKDKRYHEISRAVVLRDLYSIGIKPGDKVAWVWGSPIENKKLTESILHRLQWKTNRRIMFNAFNFSDMELEKWLRKDLTKFKPDYMYGYANTIYEVAKFVEKNKIELPKLKKIVCSAQKLEHRDYIEKIFGCKVLDHYGSREIETIGIEDENYIMHSSDDFVLVEIGNNDEIFLTPLESYGMPLLRYANGDIGIKKSQKNKSKSPFTEFNIKIGRVVEILRTVDGKKVYSGRLNRQVADRKLNVGEFQIVQKSYDMVELNIVKDKQTNEKDVKKFVQIIKNTLGSKDVNVRYLKTYPIERSGKKISYKCLIKDENPNN